MAWFLMSFSPALACVCDPFHGVDLGGGSAETATQGVSNVSFQIN